MVSPSELTTTPAGLRRNAWLASIGTGGWLASESVAGFVGTRSEHGHCGMVAVPTIEEEDAKRPGRERENLVGERTRIINRMKSDLARLGIRGSSRNCARPHS
jgi:hypothetical protein